jgi:hypothetical protein
VTASNLFKFTAHHGLVLFKHHDPVAFTEPQLGGLLAAAQGWAHAAHGAHPDTARHPTLLWNALPRSGASQFHGHAQVVMSQAPLPEAAAAAAAAAAYEAAALEQRGGAAAGCYAADVAAAHGALGLRRTLRVTAPGGGGSGGSSSSSATCFASVAPYKDCECVVHGASASSPAFVRLLHIVMRTLLDRCGVVTFNATVSGLSLAPSPPASQDEAARASSTSAEEEEEAALFGGGGVTARVVSRGHAASRASDFGALEVFGGASIGHTSPWTVAAAMDAELAARGLKWATQRR